MAAGIGVAARESRGDLIRLLRARQHSGTARQYAIDLWAEALADGAPRLTAEAAERALARLRTDGSRSAVINDQDRTAMFWLCTRLLDSPCSPTDEDLENLNAVLSDGRKHALTLLSRGSPPGPVDAALLLDALSATPLTRLARRTGLDGLLSAIDHFEASVGILAHRQRGRPGFQITDEYDVQDVFRALAMPVIPDITPEDPASKVAGVSSRLDFTSKAAALGIEVKHVKNERHAKSVRDEILLDERTYQEHPYVETMVVFVYDPEGFIRSEARPAFEADLSKAVTVAGRSVRYVVRVR